MVGRPAHPANMQWPSSPLSTARVSHHNAVDAMRQNIYELPNSRAIKKTFSSSATKPSCQFLRIMGFRPVWELLRKRENA